MNKIYLWGKIFGTEADYFIAYSLKDGDYCELPSKQFYFWYILLFLGLIAHLKTMT